MYAYILLLERQLVDKKVYCFHGELELVPSNHIEYLLTASHYSSRDYGTLSRAGWASALTCVYAHAFAHVHLHVTRSKIYLKKIKLKRAWYGGTDL